MHRGIVHLFHPSQHLWLRIVPSFLSSSSSSSWDGGNKISSMTSSSPSLTSRTLLGIELGMTERGMEEVGDIVSIRRSLMVMEHDEKQQKQQQQQRQQEEEVHDNARLLSDADDPRSHHCLPRTVVKEGDLLLTVEWEGHTITSADELYHTVWETFEGTKSIRSPVNGFLQKNISFDDNDNDFDENSVLIRMNTTLGELERATTNEILLKEMDYARILKKISPGMFKDS